LAVEVLGDQLEDLVVFKTTMGLLVGVAGFLGDWVVLFENGL